MAKTDYINNENVRKFLDLIAAAEGADYDTAFGGGKIGSLDAHPGTKKYYTNLAGQRIPSTASGRYQFVKGTWDSLQKRLKLKDFGAESQDLAAIELIRENGALNDVVNGDFRTASAKLGNIWQALPSGKDPNQAKRSLKWQDNFLQNQRGASTAPLTDEESWNRGGQAPVTQETVALSLDPLTPTQELAQAIPESPFETLVSPWQKELMQMNAVASLNEDREQAVANLLGNSYAPRLNIPDAIENSILKIAETV